MKPSIMLPLKKAVFPVAGLGTRFLPATKATPKEMLVIVDKPLIQYAVEEAIKAGFSEMIFITSSSKRALEDHFDSNFELETKLAQQEKQDLLAIVKNILPKHVSCAYIRQHEALGLGHAVLCAEPFVHQEAFAVILADDLISATPNCLETMVDVFQQKQHSLIAVEEIPLEKTSHYGVIKTQEPTKNKVYFTLEDIVEKPEPALAPSTLGVVGRYIFTPHLFHYLKKTPRGAGSEYQLTDAIAAMLKSEPVGAIRMPGKRYDCGSKIGYLEATLAHALHHPEVKGDFINVLKNWTQYL